MTVLDYEPVARGSHRSVRVAEFALLLATVGWGCAFTWAKACQDAINQTFGLASTAPLGATWQIAVRFTLAGLLWFAVFPSARRGWNRRTVLRSVCVGGLLGVGLSIQHTGLNLTSEAVSAFLTSLTIVFVPLLSTFLLGRTPGAMAWGAVVVATVGVWLMTGASPAGFGLGEFLGVACAVVFSVHIFVVNAVVPRDDPWRIAGAQVLVAGLVGLVVTLFVPSGLASLSPTSIARALSQSVVWLNIVLMILIPTMFAFGALTFFQPRLDATRSALIYLMEPIFAAAYAYVARARALGWLG
ncbi:MAG: DMT family transporter, partial [Tepidisphaeraceae bacterium]